MEVSVAGAPGTGHGKDAPALRCAAWKVCRGVYDIKDLFMITSCPPSSLLNPVLPFWNVTCHLSQCTVLPHFLSQIVPELCYPLVKWHCGSPQRCGGLCFPIISSMSKRSKLSLLCLGRRDSCELSHPAGACVCAGCPIDPLLSQEGSEIQPSNLAWCSFSSAVDT